MVKGFLRSVAAPVFSGIIAGNIVAHGYTLAARGEFMAGTLSAPESLTPIFASMIAAGLTGYFLGKRNLTRGADPDGKAPGETMPDGMKYAGISPNTGKPFYVDAADAPGEYRFEEADKYAADRGKRVPSKEELNVLFNNRAAIGGFNVTGSPPAGWYWSSLRDGYLAWAQRFSTGNQASSPRFVPAYLRLVRD